jgi:hypothetical protein
MRRSLIPLAFFLLTAGVSGAEPSRRGAHSIIAPIAGASPRSSVLVLATPHLSSIDGVEPRFLVPVVERLASFRPTIICIEELPPASLVSMEEAGGRQKEAAEMFAKDGLALGRELRKTLGLTRADAAREAEDVLARGGARLSDVERARLVTRLVASYEFASAVLQWSYLPEAFRSDTPLVPQELKAYLDRRLAARNETTIVAIALARQLGLQRLAPVDSHFDGAKLLAIGEDALAEVFDHPFRERSSKAPVYERSRAVIASGIRAGTLLPVYQYFNDDGYLAADVEAQWGWYWRSKLDSGLDRFRYALWEARNLAIASNVAMQSASPRQERVLVLIGSAHKRFVEEFVARLVHAEVVEFNALKPTH